MQMVSSSISHILDPGYDLNNVIDTDWHCKISKTQNRITYVVPLYLRYVLNYTIVIIVTLTMSFNVIKQQPMPFGE
jgi:hypothetical protein